MTSLARLRTVLAAALLAVAVVRSLWIAFTAYAIADKAASATSVFTAEVAERYRPVAAALEGVPRIGYREPGGNAWATTNYLVGRLVLLPTVVLPDDADQRLVLFDAGSEEQLGPWLQEEGVAVRERFGGGLALVEVQR